MSLLGSLEINKQVVCLGIRAALLRNGNETALQKARERPEDVRGFPFAGAWGEKLNV